MSSQRLLNSSGKIDKSFLPVNYYPEVSGPVKGLINNINEAGNIVGSFLEQRGSIGANDNQEYRIPLDSVPKGYWLVQGKLFAGGQIYLAGFSGELTEGPNLTINASTYENDAAAGGFALNVSTLNLSPFIYRQEVPLNLIFKCKYNAASPNNVNVSFAINFLRIA